MVSIEQNEESWHNLQRQNLNTNKKVIKPRKYAGVDTTKKIRLNNEQLREQKVSNESSKRDFLSNPITHPLPDIESSTRLYNNDANYPDLESWGVDASSKAHQSSALTYSSNRFNASPFLPMYFSKERRPYAVTSFQQQDNNGYINKRPYNYRALNFSSLSKKANRADDEYEFFNSNTAFSDRYIQEFISKCLRDEVIPDILIEVISNIKRTQKLDKLEETLVNDPIKNNAIDVLNNVDANLEKDSDLFSTKFIDELGYKARLPLSTPVSKYKLATTQLPPSLEQEITEIYQTQVVTMDEQTPRLPKRVEFDAYKTVNYLSPQVTSVQSQFDEVKKLERQLAIDKVFQDDILQPTIMLMCKQIALETLASYKVKVDTVQKLEIKKTADNYLVDGFMLDHFLNRMSTHGRYVSNDDDINKLVDVMMMDILLTTQNDVRKTKTKTFQNYPLKKFHVNSFINVALDTLFYELSNNLEEDMRQVDDNERNYFMKKF